MSIYLDHFLFVIFVLLLVAGLFVYFKIIQRGNYLKFRLVLTVFLGLSCIPFLFRGFGPAISDFNEDYTTASLQPNMNYAGLFILTVFILFFANPVIVDFVFVFIGRSKRYIKKFLFSIGMLILFIVIVTSGYLLLIKTLQKYVIDTNFQVVREVPAFADDYKPEIIVSNSFMPIADCLKQENNYAILNLATLLYGDTMIPSRDVAYYKNDKCLAVLFPDTLDNRSEKTLLQTSLVAETLIRIKFGEFLQPNVFSERPRIIFTDDVINNVPSTKGTYSSHENLITIRTGSNLLQRVSHEMLHSSASRVYQYAYNNLAMEEAMTTYLNRELMRSLNVSYDKVEYSNQIIVAMEELFKYTSKESLIEAYFNDDIGQPKMNKIKEDVDMQTHPYALCIFTFKLNKSIEMLRIDNIEESNKFARQAIQSLGEPIVLDDFTSSCPF
ncbi:MAG: hypothetical protein ACD_9C00156G0003 [uncultured bacterium]|nr:MAG: hypothetical protein ACD_9C00156G0003 [uncultured bacterium]